MTPTHPHLPRSAPTLDYSSSGGCGDVRASVCIWAKTERRDRDMMGVRTPLPSRRGREVFPASVRDGLGIPHDSCPIHKKNKNKNKKGRKKTNEEREQGEEFYSATFIFLLLFHLFGCNLEPSLMRRLSGHVTDTPPSPVFFSCVAVPSFRCRNCFSK